MTVFAGFAPPNSQSFLAQWMPNVSACLLGFALACALMFGLEVTFAAEIASVHAHSFIGQPLQAEVELAAMPADEAQNLRVKLAVPDTYRLGNIRRNPVLNSMRIQLQQQGQRKLILLQTSEPVLESYLHVYLEFNDGKNNSVRALTVWLEADPERPIAEYPQAPAADHPDGELALAETAHAALSASSTHSAPTAPTDRHRADAIEYKVSADAPYPIPSTTSNKPARHTTTPDTKYASNSNLQHRPVGSTPAASKQQCKPNRQEALRCELNAIENERIAAEIEVLDHKVGILRRVILAEEQPAAIEKSASVPTSSLAASATPINLKPKKLAQSAIPWRIIGISAAVFVAVALLSFLLLILKTKLQTRRKKTKAPTDKNAPKDEVAEQAHTGEENATEAPSKGKKFAFKPWLQHSLAKIRAPFGKLGQKLVQLPAKFKSILKFKRKQAASETEVKVEPDS